MTNKSRNRAELNFQDKGSVKYFNLFFQKKGESEEIKKFQAMLVIEMLFLSVFFFVLSAGITSLQ
jgi:hypothetical protein